MEVRSDMEKAGDDSKSFAEVVDERYVLVVSLYLIKKNVDLQIEEQNKNGIKKVETRKEIKIFTDSSFIKAHFQPLLRTQ